MEVRHASLCLFLAAARLSLPPRSLLPVEPNRRSSQHVHPCHLRPFNYTAPGRSPPQPPGSHYCSARTRPMSFFQAHTFDFRLSIVMHPIYSQRWSVMLAMLCYCRLGKEKCAETHSRRYLVLEIGLSLARLLLHLCSHVNNVVLTFYFI